MKILVALSGGVDSSVAACLLKREGHDVIGVRFRLWSDPHAPADAMLFPRSCCDAQSAYRARFVADLLQIPLHNHALEEQFERDVVHPFLQAYRDGDTPNPCVLCNRVIKFAVLEQLADAWGCDAWATGHYARVERASDADQSARMVLLEARDSAKDQSYFLYGLSQTQLQRTIFPLGSLLKSEVFQIAQSFGIPVHEEYRESQDICFIPEKSHLPFLRRHMPEAFVEGPMIRKADGAIIGMHHGLPGYTIGQRKGLGIGGLSIPLEVTEKRKADNALIVDAQRTHQSHSVLLRDIRWMGTVPSENHPLPFLCRTRSHAPIRSGHLTYCGTEGEFAFDTPAPLQSPGQSLVLYRDRAIWGGGIMAGSGA